MRKEKTSMATTCYHCGDTCAWVVLADDKEFCCDGCKQVYLLLNENGLCNYYELDKAPGIKAKGRYSDKRFAYLDHEELIQKLLRFRDENQSHVQFYLPTMHCASCIWLLENMHRINPAIISSKTNFQRKEVFIIFNHHEISLRGIVELLAFVGYEPYISLNDSEDRKEKKLNRNHIYKIGVAGFCFTNIMMLSFPEYFSGGNIGVEGLRQVFTYLILALSIPVLLYSASGFFISGWKGIRQGWLNIDAPIALAILIAFGRSLYEIISGTGPGYLDSMSGIVFFMLIGRWFQNRTYDAFSFDRDYTSYFPLGVTAIIEGIEKNIPLSSLKKGDFIRVRHEEMIPADGILVNGMGNIDYSFVSGEIRPVDKKKGELIYAGGKQVGQAIDMEVVTPVTQSYITRLWNNDIFHNKKNKEHSFIHPWSRYFTYMLFIIATITALYWSAHDPSRLWPSVTAVLIVACPCSLLLSATFTYGNMLSTLGKNKLYLKNASVIETLGKVNTIVLDKTGTLTHHQTSVITYEGEILSDHDRRLIYSITRHSAHPLSKIIAASLGEERSDIITPESYREISGKGLEAKIDNRHIRIGSSAFVYKNTQRHGDSAETLVTQRHEEIPGDADEHRDAEALNPDYTLPDRRNEPEYEFAFRSHPVETNPFSTIRNATTIDAGTSHFPLSEGVHISFDNAVRGRFLVTNDYRTGIKEMAGELVSDEYDLYVLSGDNDQEKSTLRNMFGSEAHLYFRQSPQDKMDYIKFLQEKGGRILMLGDGLNDAGALRQSEVGIAVSDSTNLFSPASDAILDGSNVHLIARMLRFVKKGKTIVAASFALSILYNLAGLSFATRGQLSPLIAAILMPASSISIVLFVSLYTRIAARLNGLK